ncbi:replication protein ori43 (plasmid) [Bacillus methanolicus]|uniref:primase C-terminal domain-containing protein n=1 Tax=Bacillus methanolicus TaxID=1471 RepID=UPI002380376F|nr:primase C-terminal domain-containing protein [Bacillus methanolicus]MDE3841094.1 replication protein ori43 [Bacillus methanolicus]
MEALKIIDERLDYTQMDIIRFMIHGALFEGDPSHWSVEERKREKVREKAREVGVIHVTYSKEHLMNGQSIVVSSFGTLERQMDRFSHWTPQVYMWGKRNNVGRNAENLRFITCIGVEIDKKISIQEIHYAAAMLGLPSPNLILSTPRGMQWFYVLSSPFAGSHKARRAGKFVAEEVKQAFVNAVGADAGANPLGYFRFPKEDNIEFFYAKPVNTEWLLTWAKDRSRKAKRPAAVKGKHQSRIFGQAGIMDDPAIQAIIQNVMIKGSKGVLGRNNAIFTLSLAMKYEGKTEEEIYNQMDEWNSQLKHPIPNREVRAIIKSAMKSDYKAPGKAYVEELAGVKMEYRFCIRTPKKPREERKRSHLYEREQDIIDYLEAHCTANEPYIQGSIRELAKLFGMAKQSFQAVLERSKKIIKKTFGRGKNAKTYITCRNVLVKSHKAMMKTFVSNKEMGVVESSQLCEKSVVRFSQRMMHIRKDSPLEPDG